MSSPTRLRNRLEIVSDRKYRAEQRKESTSLLVTTSGIEASAGTMIQKHRFRQVRPPFSDDDPANPGIVSGGSFRPFRQIGGTGEL